jgi:hypothetical protein
MTVNGIEVYKLSSLAEQEYRNNALKGANAEKEAIERKLTALILNATKILQMPDNKWKYSFGSCDIYVDENNMEIYDIIWTTGGHISIVEPEIVASLEDTYIELGLSKKGNTIVNYVDVV